MLTMIVCLNCTLGRRALQSYLLMFIHSSPALQPDHDYEKILERALNSYPLGEHVAAPWALGKVLKWRPMNVGSLSKPLGPDVDVPRPLQSLERANARVVAVERRNVRLSPPSLPQRPTQPNPLSLLVRRKSSAQK